MIDPLIAPIVNRLNVLGLTTTFSCQGNHDRDQAPQIAYICFQPGITLPGQMIEAFEEQNWQLDKFECGGSPEYAVYSITSCFEYDEQRLTEKNQTFLEGWKSILGAYQNELNQSST